MTQPLSPENELKRLIESAPKTEYSNEEPRNDEAYILRLLGRIADLERALTAAQTELAKAKERCGELEKERDEYKRLASKSEQERDAAYDKSWANVQRADRAEKDAAASGPKDG